MLNTKTLLALFISLSFSLYVKPFTIQLKDSTTFNAKEFTSIGYKLSKENQDKAYEYFEKGAAYFKLKKDTVAYLEGMIGLSEIEKRNGKYNKSFDILWGVLPLAKKTNYKKPLIRIHRKLGTLYGVYGKDSLALFHLKKGLEIGKKNIDKNHLASSYLPIAEQYINLKEYDSALKYLDSCYLTMDSNKRLIYIDAYYGHIYTKKGNSHKANIYFNNLTPLFEKNKFAFLAMVYWFQADLHLLKKQPDSAIYYLEKSLMVIDTMKVHIEIKPTVLEHLANLHFEKNDKTKAFEYMNAAKTISDSLFHMQSKHNKELFEIKSKYQEDLSKKDEEIIAQNKVLELKDKASFRLKLILGILVGVVLIGLLIYRLRSQSKHMAYNKEKNKAILEVKNKELTANALQMIEKENAVNELLETIKENIPEKHKSLYTKYKQNNEKIWDDFHLQFTQTNNKFYKDLLELHPKLTPNDLKCCALIKLKFDSKEMSQILGISLHSVHMARSRVRKKLGLARKDSLSNYLSLI